MSPRVQEAATGLLHFLFERVYDVCSAGEETERARRVIRFLYSYFVDHCDKLPAEYALRGDTVERRVLDYIAGMTDQYALRIAGEIFPSKQWFIPDTMSLKD